MKFKTIIVASLSTAVVAGATQSCVALATTGVGLAVLKKILLGGISKGLSVLGNKQAFLQNDLIDLAMPKPLREINQILEPIAPSLVEKERDYIAQAAVYTVKIAEPILIDAVNSLTAEDVVRISQGGKGAATALLKEKTAAQLMLAIQPKVDEKLNEFGIVRSLNLALQGNQLLGGILGEANQNYNLASGGLSRLASEQMVNGLFNIVESYEKQNSIQLLEALQK